MHRQLEMTNNDELDPRAREDIRVFLYPHLGALGRQCFHTAWPQIARQGFDARFRPLWEGVLPVLLRICALKTLAPS